MNKLKEKKITITKGIAAIIFIAMLIVCCLFMIRQVKEKKINELLDLGNKYISEMDYENAVVVYDQVIAIDPKCGEAYLGKAQAQYALGWYEEAFTTLEEGIAIVDDSSMKEHLQRILDAYIESMEGYEEEIRGDAGNDGTEEIIKRELLLNYKRIVRTTNTKENEIQLEILGDEGNEKNYIWSSSNPGCASISDTGLVTCLPVEGSADISVEDGKGQRDNCTIEIHSSDNWSDANDIRIRMDGEEERYYVLSVVKKEDKERVIFDKLGIYIYYSGDIVIPETLQFQGKELKVTGIAGDAFRGSDELDSVYIPEEIEIFGDGEENPFNYCTQLKEIRVDEKNEFLKVVDGVLYSKDGKTLYAYPSGKSDSSFTLPKEVKKVYSGAFVGCSNLKEIWVEEGNTHYESIDGALIEKLGSWLIAYPIGNERTSYTVPESVKSLAKDAFYSSRLEEVDCSSLELISDSAFRQCQELEKIVGGDKTVYIYWYPWSSGDRDRDKPVEIQGINSMKKLEEMRIRVSDKQDFSEFASLEKLRRLDMQFEELSDLSWIEGMESLRYIEFRVENFTVTDLTPLFNMKDLQSINIGKRHFYDDNYNTEFKELSEDVKQQIIKLKSERPEMDIYIWDELE